MLKLLVVVESVISICLFLYCCVQRYTCQRKPVLVFLHFSCINSYLQLWHLKPLNFWRRVIQLYDLITHSCPNGLILTLSFLLPHYLAFVFVLFFNIVAALGLFTSGIWQQALTQESGYRYDPDWLGINTIHTSPIKCISCTVLCKEYWKNKSYTEAGDIIGHWQICLRVIYCDKETKYGSWMCFVVTAYMTTQCGVC